jgi:hypothetical protein
MMNRQTILAWTVTLVLFVPLTAWGNFRLGTQQKGSATAYSDGRYMFTYAQAGGKWVIVSMHSLLEPLVH